MWQIDRNVSILIVKWWLHQKNKKLHVKRTCISLERILTLIKSKELHAGNFSAGPQNRKFVITGLVFQTFLVAIVRVSFMLFFFVLSGLHATDVRLFSSGHYNVTWLASRIDSVVGSKVSTLNSPSEHSNVDLNIFLHWDWFFYFQDMIVPSLDLFYKIIGQSYADCIGGISHLVMAVKVALNTLALITKVFTFLPWTRWN